MQLVILLLLWRSLLGVSESTIAHASNVSKRQLQYGGTFPPPSYQAHQPANHFVHTPALLYDPGYNAQHLHEVDTGTDNTTEAAELRSALNATLPLQQRTQTNAGLDTQFEVPQTFSHIYFPHAFAAGAQHALSRTAAHAFPGETAAALAARNSGRTYSTSSTYFVPLSVLYHPHADAQQPQSVYTQRPAQQQQQQMQAYQPLPPPLPPPAHYQQYAPQAALPGTQPTATPSIAAQSTQQQQPTAPAQTAYAPPALPPLPRLPPLLPPSSPNSAAPLPLNFQAPFQPSQFLGYMQERDTRNAAPPTTVSAVARAPQHTQAYSAYPPQQQAQVDKPIYEHMSGGAKQQNYQAAVTQQARQGRYIYMAPHNGYALFKAA